MNKQSGISTAGIALAVVVLAAAGGGFLGWQQHQELARTRTDLAGTKSALDKASADAHVAKTDAAAARKELDEQKATFEQMRVERDAAKAFLESEKTHAARLQEDLTLAREQLAYLRARSSSAAQFAPAMPVQPQPMVIRSQIRGIQAARPQGAAANPLAPSTQQTPAPGYARPPQ